MGRILLFGVVFQGLWWVTVLGASDGRALPGSVLLVLFAAVALAEARRRGARAPRLLAAWGAAALVGASFDAALAGAGVLAFPPQATIGPLPVWMLALWAGFAALLPGPLAALSARPWLSAVFGLVGGPASYWAAVATGAASFPAGAVAPLTALGLAWAALLPAFAALGAWAARPASADAPADEPLRRPEPVPVRGGAGGAR